MTNVKTNHAKSPELTKALNNLTTAILAKATETNTAQALVDAIEELGIKKAFGVPGGFIEPIVDALTYTNIDMSMVRHESASAMSADGYYRQTRKPALAFSTAGPGATNMITGIACAYAERIPMLIITPQNSTDTQGMGALQDSSKGGVDIVSMFESVTVYNETVTSPKQLEAKFNAAIDCMLNSDRKGPVHLSIPIDILKAQCNSINLSRQVLRKPRDVTDLMSSRLRSASNAAIVIGESCNHATAISLMSMATFLRLPVVEVPASKGIVPTQHPMNKGVFGMGGHSSAKQVIEEADFIISAGCEPTETSSGNWNTEYLNEKTMFVSESLDTLARCTRGDRALVNLETLFDGICQELHIKPMAQSTYPLTPVKLDCVPSSKPKSSNLMQVLSKTLPHESSILFEPGNSFLWGLHSFEVSRFSSIGRKVHLSMAFASMGWAIGASIGVAKGSSAQTVCVSGDGSYLMSSQELSTAVQENLNLIFVILNDSVYGMVMHGQRLGGGQCVGFDLPTIDFAAQAKAMGAQGIIVNTSKELMELDISQLKGPCVVDVRIDREEVPPMGDRMKAFSSSD